MINFLVCFHLLKQLRVDAYVWPPEVEVLSHGICFFANQPAKLFLSHLVDQWILWPWCIDYDPLLRQLWSRKPNLRLIRRLPQLLGFLPFHFSYLKFLDSLWSWRAKSTADGSILDRRAHIKHLNWTLATILCKPIPLLTYQIADLFKLTLSDNSCILWLII